MKDTTENNLRVKEILKQQGNTQKWLAEQMGISPIALNKILQRDKPDFKHIESMAKALGVTKAELYSDYKTTAGSLTCPMTNEEAIKYLKQLYPHGGHCWLDEQRLEAIGLAVEALSPWKKPEEKMPKHCQNVFIAYFDVQRESYQYYIGFYNKDTKLWYMADFGYADTCEVSYWMPIPTIKAE